MSSYLVIAPILLQFLISVTLMFLWKKVMAQRILSIIGSSIALIFSIVLFSQVWQNGTMVIQAGNWEAPYGITLVSDTLSATLVLLTGILGLAISVFAAGSIVNARARFGFFPILHFLFMGLCGSFLAGDIFNLYVWFEIIIISSFVLLTIGGEKAQIEGAVKYFTLNILASVIFLTAIAVLYGITGTLNMADLSLKIAAIEDKTLVNICAMIFFVGFGIKSAVFPLYFWLPASYHTPPHAVAAIFGGLLTKVGVYAMIRVFTLIFTLDPFLENVLMGVAMLTLFSGAVGALVQRNLQKIFSYLIICHIGFMVAGLGMGSTLALTGAIFYMIHDIVVKANLFMVGGLLYRINGTSNIKRMGEMYARYPLLSLLMAVPLFSLVGIPPLSGFWPKLSLIMGGLETGNYVLIGFILFGSFMTLFIIAKVWAEVFWKKKEVTNPPANFRFFEAHTQREKILILIPIIFLSILSLGIGFGAGPIQALSERISGELSDVSTYITIVLGEKSN
ncbi:MAG: proton-conducting transporter membrane subunit [Algoriphagus sp.]|uniref:proton-conducting transporter transmembrane domain-containing protein n=1 Tax=Algoriphagus sp. TaxID=1872435 RepID=UPI002731C9B6|nr:proton-conducting transporter membrane subunit [Algoriphagus sp.]MDP2040637.1 proton-conducting transporter membrane subunit [Algoriphagus sp.]MDP3470939.1 proton-conducting transporter membrane subunit [Algoriphagus sp.]